jgi:hypothetical protein
MDETARQQDYLAKARTAEEYALQAEDTVTRNTWLRLAQGYRDLVEFVQAKSGRGISWAAASTKATERSKPTQ